MTKTATVKVEIESRLKAEAEALLANSGLNSDEAIALFYEQIVAAGTLPFAVKTPNSVTLATFEKTDQDSELIVCEDAEDMFKKLGI